MCSETQVDQYLHQTRSKLSADLFIFDSSINLKQWFSTDGRLITSDISDGQENVPICAVNEVDDDQPAHLTYRVERTPVEGVPLVLNEPTMTCCSCTDGCRDRSQCACEFVRLYDEDEDEENASIRLVTNVEIRGTRRRRPRQIDARETEESGGNSFSIGLRFSTSA